jgi:hypothetical protein
MEVRKLTALPVLAHSSYRDRATGIGYCAMLGGDRIAQQV